MFVAELQIFDLSVQGSEALTKFCIYFAYMWPTLVRMMWHFKGHSSQHHSHPLSFLVDYVAGGCLIDQNTVKQSNIPTVDLPEPVTFSALDGRPSAKVIHRTIPLSLIISKNH